jgi:cell division protein FtsW
MPANISRNSRTMKKTLFATPASAYYIILGTVSILSTFGVVMVLSASSVRALSESGNSFAIAIRQVLYLVISITLAWLATNLKERLWIPQARLALLASIFFLLLPQVPGIGKSVGGNTNWIEFGGFSLQPSEFAKFAMILWCALMIRNLSDGANPIPKLIPGMLIVMGLILLGRDLGTAMVVAGIFMAILFVAGIESKKLIALGAVATLAVLALVASNQTRLSRFAAFSDPFSEANYKSAGWQQAHSIMGLASGGAFGTGLGSGKQKWGSLPEAHTDFIFSVIGEELGLLGTLAVLSLYALLILAIFRVALRTTKLFDKYVLVGIGSWFAIQIIMNIGSVISMMPVVGVTLPFISYGGSSLIASFLGIGYVLGVLRRDPVVAEEIKMRRKK